MLPSGASILGTTITFGREIQRRGTALMLKEERLVLRLHQGKAKRRAIT
ncbi:hypothetical protein [Synechococcus sp. M16CYN]